MGKRLSEMTDAELEAIANAPKADISTKPAKGPEVKRDLSHLSDSDLMKIAGQEPLGIADKVTNGILGIIGEVGRQYDRFAAAPARAALGAMQDDKGFGGLATGAKAFARQWGKEPELAPTGKEMATKAGLSDEPYIRTPFRTMKGETVKVSPAGIAGAGIDAIADPLNFIPGVDLIKGGAKVGVMGIKEGVGGVIKGGAKTIDAITGTKAATKTVEGATNVAKKLAMTELFNPKIASDFEYMKSVAERNGIDTKLLPESVEFGPESTISRHARSQREGPLGEPALKNFERGLSQVKDATRRKIEQIGGGVILSAPEAGALIRDSYQQAVDAFFSKIKVSYDSVAAKHPDLMMTPESMAIIDPVINEIWTFAEKRARLALTDQQASQANQLLRTVDAFMKTDKDLGSMTDLLKHLGDAAFQADNKLMQAAPDVARMRQIYHGVSEAVIETIDKGIGSDVAQQLRANNKAVREFMSEKNLLAKTLGNPALSDEGVFRQLVANSDTKKIGALKAIMSPEALANLKGAYLESLIKTTSPDGDFAFKPLMKAIESKAQRDVIASFIPDAELTEISDLVALGDRFGLAVLSTSGTGASNAFRNIIDNTKHAIISDKFIETLKERARSAGQLPPPPAGIRVPIHGLQGGGITLPYRSPLEQRAKGAQVISTQDNEPNNDRRKAVRGK